MFSKIVYYWPILILVVILFMWFGLSKRRNLPAQEVVPLDGGIAVINAGKWCNNKLQISLLSKDDPIQKKHYNEAGECTFRGLSNEKRYTIEIKRTDLKGMLLYKKTEAEVMPKKGGSKYIVLVGASVGKSWEFPKLGERIKIEDHIVLGNRTAYEFDKSTAINALIQLSIPVSGVIVKECSAYFPRDIDQSKEQIERWVSQIQSGNITPILATVVPVLLTTR